MKVLFLHGLEGNPDGTKATYLRHKYGAHVPDLDTSELKKLRDDQAETEWQMISKKKIIKATNKPMRQALQAIQDYKPDLVIGSSMGGALLATLIMNDDWNGPALFLASGAQYLFGITDLMNRSPVSRHWIHGTRDTIIPYTHSLNAAQESYGTCQLINDDHRLESIIGSGALAEAIENLITDYA